jgi:hypothetical protein
MGGIQIKRANSPAAALFCGECTNGLLAPVVDFGVLKFKMGYGYQIPNQFEVTFLEVKIF